MPYFEHQGQYLGVKQWQIRLGQSPGCAIGKTCKHILLRSLNLITNKINNNNNNKNDNDNNNFITMIVMTMSGS